MKLLHVYGQDHEHEDVFVVGNTEGLQALRDAIDRALAKQDNVDADLVFAGDGEGYMVFAIVNNAEWDEARWQKLALPYSDDMYHYASQSFVPIESHHVPYHGLVPAEVYRNLHRSLDNR